MSASSAQQGQRRAWQGHDPRIHCRVGVRLCDEQGGPEDRHALRADRCPALLHEIDEQRRALLGQSSEQGQLAQALVQPGNQGSSRVRTLQGGRIPIHDNACESAIRPAAAAIFTLIENCRRADVDPHSDLLDVLTRWHANPAGRIEELFPANGKHGLGAAAAR